MAKRSMKILMLPWLAHGHISPFLELAKRLSRLNFTLFLCSTPASLDSIKASIPEDYSQSIRLVEVRLPESPELPKHLHTTKGLPTRLMTTLKRSFLESGPTLLSDIIHEIAPDLMIYDVMLWWAANVAAERGIPAVVLYPTSAAMWSFSVHAVKRGREKFPFEKIYFDPSFMRRIMSTAAEEIESGVTTTERCIQAMEASSEIVLLKSSRELEGKFMDYLSNLLGKKSVPLGPLVRDSTALEYDDNDLIGWLDGKEKSSTVFVSFGTEYFPDEEETEEVAHGLELSEVPFIWVITSPEGQQPNLEHVLPDGFLGRVKQRGVVVQKWAPQGRILAHPSIGGFVSHCGWSSVLEGMKFGVPIVAVPMQLDQPVNARVIDDIGVGVEVKRDGEGCLHREEIARVIKDVVVGANGESVRKKAKEIGEMMRNNGDEEDTEIIDEVGLEFMKLCGRS